ncbi:amidase [Terasakiella brassicae]|uniref:Amidase n=1 Tax=Terasakiella brassicae TaxID=1634917 RepID=A0A917C4T3_9PROT|nr:creatininase family protein [Terasakiella brassicae]GGF68977.1 amidase [Terasakiella brassicae]
MELQKSTWPEVENYLQSCQTILIPIGSTEQHGPSGMIGTDSMIAEAITKELARRSGLMCAPVLSIGMAEHHMAFAGTISLQPQTLSLVIRDVVHSLEVHGFAEFIFINGHGGNGPVLQRTFQEDVTNCRFYNWYMGAETRKLRALLYADQEGRHATPSEIAVVQYLDESTLRNVACDPVCAPALAYEGAQDMRDKHPDGRIGANVSLADPVDGKRLFETSVDDLMATLIKDGTIAPPQHPSERG